jgi:DNA-binding HxlR family transcriptional regulator
MGRKSRSRTRVRVRLNFLAFPLRSSLGVLGRKWALLILMNISMRRANRFNELRRESPGMSKRILAMRLRELEQSGFIVRVEQRTGYVRWQLTPKGQDVLPVLLTVIHFVSKWREGDESTDPNTSIGSDFEIAISRTRTPGTASSRGPPTTLPSPVGPRNRSRPPT